VLMIDSVDEEPAPLRLGFDAYQRTHCVPLADSPSRRPRKPWPPPSTSPSARLSDGHRLRLDQWSGGQF
jgi:hypothetical protein